MKLAKGTKIQTTFNDYTLIEQVGSGGNARVFSAANREGEVVALKFVEKTISVQKLKRFKNEICFCETHKHKNIVCILDRGYACLDNKDYGFYVMPLYEESLREKMKKGIPHEKIVQIFTGVLEGLQYAHKHDAIHRDIKPENIMFKKNSYEPVICDFGIAHFAQEDLATIIETRASDRMANFQYAAPEQRVRGGNILPQTDIYAAGLILNEMFTGDIPQAQGYKTIATIDKDYKYLDAVFEQLFVQEAVARLYPEEKIISEIKILAEKQKKQKEKEDLQKVIFELIEPEEFEATVIAKEYRQGALIFIFDRELPTEWYRYITQGTYNSSYLLGYDHTRLKHSSKNELAMPIRGSENENTLKTIIGHVEDWAKTTNVAYSKLLKQRAREEQENKERIRKAEIEKLDRDNAINSILKNL